MHYYRERNTRTSLKMVEIKLYHVITLYGQRGEDHMSDSRPPNGLPVLQSVLCTVRGHHQPAI